MKIETKYKEKRKNFAQLCFLHNKKSISVIPVSLHIKVLYRTEGFVDKNNDLLYRDLSQAMYKATHSLIKQLFPEGNPAKVNLKRPPTAGFQFKASVGTLMRNLQTKNPNYIR